MGKLPHGGRWSRAPSKKFSETVVFIHHFGGNRWSSKRYREYLNELGYDCVAFNLQFNSAPTWRHPLKELRRLIRDTKAPYQQIWTNNLRDILEKIPGGKILFSFSSPSLAAVRAIAEEQRTDIRAWICDGGPFLDFFDCFRNYYIHQTHLPKWAASIGASLGLVLITGLGFEHRLHKWMQSFPTSVPVLSIRAGMDEMVPSEAIQKFFDQGPQIQLKVVEIHPAQHLAGFKYYPEVYKPVVADFLFANSTKIELPS